MISPSELLFIVIVIGIVTIISKIFTDKKLDDPDFADKFIQQLEKKKQLSTRPIPYLEEMSEILNDFQQTNLIDPSNIRIRAMKAPSVNVFVIPGHVIFFTEGFLTFLDDELLMFDELAGIFAHELGHLKLGHVEEKFRKYEQAQQIKNIVDKFHTGGVIKVASLLMEKKLSREHEFEADKFAVELLSAAGYSPLGLCDALEKMKKFGGMPKWAELLSTHPYTNDRIARMKLMSMKQLTEDS